MRRAVVPVARRSIGGGDPPVRTVTATGPGQNASGGVGSVALVVGARRCGPGQRSGGRAASPVVAISSTSCESRRCGSDPGSGGCPCGTQWAGGQGRSIAVHVYGSRGAAEPVPRRIGRERGLGRSVPGRSCRPAPPARRSPTPALPTSPTPRPYTYYSLSPNKTQADASPLAAHLPYVRGPVFINTPVASARAPLLKLAVAFIY